MEVTLILLLGLVAFLSTSTGGWVRMDSSCELTASTRCAVFCRVQILCPRSIRLAYVSLLCWPRSLDTHRKLYNNSLITLPEFAFQDLTALENLDLSSNALTTLPEGVFRNLTELQDLDLSTNILTTLPEGTFNSLTALRELGMPYNNFTTLPEGIFLGLTSLEILKLYDNRLTNLPEGVFQDLTALQEVYLGQNSLTTLPEGIFRNLGALEELSLKNSGLTTLPETILRNLTVLDELKRLFLANVPFFSSSRSLGNHRWLVNNTLTTLPETIFQDLTTLQYLAMKNNTLTTLPEVLFQDLTGLLLLGELDDDTISYNDIVGLRIDPYGEECGCSILGVTDNVCGEEICTPGPQGYTCDTPAPTFAPELTMAPVATSGGSPAPKLTPEPTPAIVATLGPVTPAPVIPVRGTLAPLGTLAPFGTLAPGSALGSTPAPSTASEEADSSTTGIVVGVVAGALAVGFVALGVFLRRRRQAAKGKDADPSAPHLDFGDNLEHGHGERQLDISPSVPIVVAGGNGAGGPPPPAQQSSTPPPQPLPPPYAPHQRDALPPPPPYTHVAAHLPDALPPAAADRQHAPAAAETNTSNNSKPVESSLAAPTVGALKKSTSEQETTPPRDKNGDGGGSSRTADTSGGGGGDAAGEGGIHCTAEQVSLPRAATNSTAEVSTEERTAELCGLGFSVDEGADDAPPPVAAAAAAAAAASGRRKTSSGVEYGQAVLAAAEELAHHCQIPGVSEAATVVSILVHLVTDSRDSLSRGDLAVKRCRSIVMMLERAAKVLGKGGDTNSEVERALLEEVHDAVSDLVDLIKTYQNKNKLSKVLMSTLFKRRQEELDAVVDKAILHLHLGLQVQVGQDVAEGLDLHKRSTAEAKAESLAEARRARRQRKLDQVEIPDDHVVITEEMLGRGGFGEVYLADYNGHNAAAKVGKKIQRKAFLRELDAMIRLRHPHTVNVYGAITSLPDRLILVLELLPGGDLRTMLKNSEQPLPEEQSRQIIKDICAGMAFLHSKSTVHGDLKSANILLDARGRAKIGDFGTSRWTQNTERSTGLATYTTNPGPSTHISFAWTAPEVLEKQTTSKASDVYSFGIVVWEVLSRQLPWADQAQPRDIYLRVVIHGDRPALPADAPVDIADMLLGCWAQEPTERPTFQALSGGEKVKPVVMK
ncbi:putative CTR1-like protein kinase/ leucine rich repeat-containing protein [Ectocarpus siliculosus]|uniref:CTR1-like protein kinase/ leucine rich repeat-containing protein n=1 Tax=Ectocarpus siliculosus TaxID=2880 RepID=D7FN19_ECTSI|nr:putative CTR1-like protein kinase/ leucine rich repeat-containing protein [Ectocarpus siliculosus]|eukprot:CBJ30083.1 putative CTR1-like protein kinase/ leucine rich repeat-containing protein [Ectocarpus siliculosus]